MDLKDSPKSRGGSSDEKVTAAQVDPRIGAVTPPVAHQPRTQQGSEHGERVDLSPTVKAPEVYSGPRRLASLLHDAPEPEPVPGPSTVDMESSEQADTIRSIGPPETTRRSANDEDAVMYDETPAPSANNLTADTQSSSFQSFSQENSQAGDGRQLNVSDALTYLDAVRASFHDQPDVYNDFLDIMKDFKSQHIDTPGVIERVSSLFKGRPKLLQGFNMFLPLGYRITCSVDDFEVNIITVTTPSGTTVQTAGGRPQPVETVAGPSGSAQASSSALLDSAISADSAVPYTPEQISPAIEYVTRIKQRFADNTELYQEFLDILNLYKKGSPVDEAQLAKRIARLFQDAPDLLSQFQVFMPQGVLPNPEDIAMDQSPELVRRKGDSSSSLAVPVQKRKRKPVGKEKEKEVERPRELPSKVPPRVKQKQNQTSQPEPFNQYATPATPPPTMRPHDLPPPPAPIPHPPPQITPDDAQFFERVKRFLGSKDTYHEFLKLINLFTQEIIGLGKLVERSQYFLGDGELMIQFKDILGWTPKMESERFLYPNGVDGYSRERSERLSKEDFIIRNGPSYRRLPGNERNVNCSGRDEMCRSVLNDEWVSHPNWVSDDSAFIPHRKNMYEEALHRTEEERHEYDFHVEAINRTIAMLEPINNKILSMPPEERAVFTLKPNFGGVSKSIHQRIIKKVYGREAGLEVIQAIHDYPSMGVPVVLNRLKQKEEEWKRAQREWNKVWREVDARNYQKSLDHQGITFKASDKKAITTKSFVSQIEVAREEQKVKRASFVDPNYARTLPKYHFSYVLDDSAILQDVMKLTLSYLDRLQHQITYAERRKMETFFRGFLPLFFMLDPHQFNASSMAGVGGEPNFAEDFAGILDSTGIMVSNTQARSNRHGRRAGNDLRKKHLKNLAQEKGQGRKAKAGPSNSTSRPASLEPMAVDDVAEQANHRHSGPHGDGGANSATAGPSTIHRAKKPQRNGVFFANTTLYAVLRLYELLYSRLNVLKTLGKKLASDPSSPYISTQTAADLVLMDVAPPESRLLGITNGPNPASHFYEYLLESCERLFDGEIDQHTFEEISRYMFGTKAYIMFTVDKVIAALIKQVQNVLTDPHSIEILEAFRRERDLASPSEPDRLNYREQCQGILGSEESLLRVDWLPESSCMTMQLLGKDDPSYDDTKEVTEKWKEYLDSYVSEPETQNVDPQKLRLPFMKRDLRSATSVNLDDTTRGQSGLEIKVCLRTYRLFFVAGSEDVFWRTYRKDDLAKWSRYWGRRGLRGKR